MRLTFTALLLAVAAFAQHPAPKNLKLLPADENLIPTMRSFAAALGQKCDFCHVQGDFASDEKHTKEIARHMISMAKDINAKFPDGKTHVTCYTCHRGATEPAMAPEAAK
jgi:Photosynthetic reaction centre cytochrome C subunit